MSLGKRLAQIRGELTQKEFAGMFGIAKDTLARYERDEYSPTSKFIEALSIQLGINPAWLILGTGPEKQGDVASMSVESQAAVARPASASPERCLSPDDFIIVPMLESRVAAGPEGEILYEEIKDYYPFKRWWIEKIAGQSTERKKCLVLVTVRGDSMSPTINQGEVVLVDTYETERIEIRTGQIYLVILPDGSSAIKRLALSKENGRLKLICISDNVAVYRPFEFELAPGRSLKNYVLGRVRWCGKEFD